VDRCNELYMKDTTGVCTLCEALAERDQCERVGTHAMQRRGVFTLLSRYAFPLGLLVLGGLLLSLTWFIPRSPVWRSTILRFVAENPVFVAALLLSLILPLFWLFLWKLPQWQVAALPEMKDRIDLESKVRQTMAQILGGAAFLVGLYFTSQTLHVSQQGQITDRFTKAIGQLGAENLAVRLGGIYALERIARDSESDHWAVMEVLTAFVREQTQGRLHTSQSEVAIRGSKDQDVPSPPADIQAILTVIGRLTRTYRKGESQALNLSVSQLKGADLEGAQLEGANLGEAQLEGANLRGAQLEGAILSQHQINIACVDENTTLPPALTRPAPCPTKP
jgi:hypothetical protein